MRQARNFETDQTNKLPDQIPIELIASLQAVKGFDESSFLKVHTSGETLTSIRFNPHKPIPEGGYQVIGKVPWSSYGYYLGKRPSFTTDPLFHAGAYYVQEASSMFLEEAIRQTVDLKTSLKVLDLCAAPGGKSTLVQSIISGESVLVANEVIKQRVNVLSENMSKWGGANVVVTNNDPADFKKLPGYFDLIVLDAPCSGSGLFRKDPGAIDEWSLQNVSLCSQRQQRILADILPSLKAGGILIYSTCSYSPPENEDMADYLLSGAGNSLSTIKLHTDPAWNIIETRSHKQQAYGYRFYPDKLKGEGFYLAAFRHQGSSDLRQEIPNRGNQSMLTKKEATLAGKWVKDMQHHTFFKWQEEVLMMASSLVREMNILQKALYLKKAGVKAGSIIREDFIPDHQLALSHNLSTHIPFIELDLEAALEYLRRSVIVLPSNVKGWVLMKYAGIPLGWVKILPNRVNNYYPKDWRILNK